MMFTTLLLTAVLAADKPRLAVLDVQAVGAEPAQAVALGEAISQELDKRGFFQVMTARDVRTLLGVERQRQLLGCTETDCTAELAGALGSRFVLQSTLTRLGETFQLSVQMLDSEKAQSVARSVRIARDVPQLIALLPFALAEATGTPLPPAPSKVLPWTLIGLGAVAFAGGGIITIDGFSRERAIRNELRDETSVLQTRGYYVDELDAIRVNKMMGFVGLGLGAGLVTLGVLLMPKDPGAASVAVVPNGSGASVVGVFP
ncbi:MAG TPA: hypothetical protein VGD87_16740 [Archangium sp.]